MIDEQKVNSRLLHTQWSIYYVYLIIKGLILLLEQNLSGPSYTDEAVTLLLPWALK